MADRLEILTAHHLLHSKDIVRMDFAAPVPVPAQVIIKNIQP